VLTVLDWRAAAEETTELYYTIFAIFTLLAKKRVVPEEIDDHFKLYGKEPWEVDYGEKCPLCNVRIDEYGFCSCGSSVE
jgi:hypothetical protein